MVTGHESWFYHRQIGQKSSNAAWVARGNPPPTVVRRSRFAPRTLLSIFFKSTGAVFIHRVERGQTINHEYDINSSLEPVLEEIKNQRPSLGVHGIKLHHDNGRPHIHKEVVSYLESEGVTVMPHPPNSPDLAPCDFWLFDLIKQNLDDQDDSDSLYESVTKFMRSLKKEEYKKRLLINRLNEWSYVSVVREIILKICHNKKSDKLLQNFFLDDSGVSLLHI